MKLYDEENETWFEDDSTARLHDHQGGLQSWEVVVLILVGVVCFLVITAAMIFAVKQQLCGHCVKWADSASELTKACTSALKRRYEHINPEENGSKLEATVSGPGRGQEASIQNTSIL